MRLRAQDGKDVHQVGIILVEYHSGTSSKKLGHKPMDSFLQLKLKLTVLHGRTIDARSKTISQCNWVVF